MSLLEKGLVEWVHFLDNHEISDILERIRKVRKNKANPTTVWVSRDF